MSDTPDTPLTPPAWSVVPSTQTHDIAQLRAAAVAVTGLRPELVDRLQGDTLDALVADAETLAGLTAPLPAAPAAPALDAEDGFDGGTRREAHPYGSMSSEHIAKLAKTDPTRFNELLESGQIDLRRVVR
jgi:hypothetical protein